MNFLSFAFVIFAIILFVSAEIPKDVILRGEILNGCIEMIDKLVQNGTIQDDHNIIYAMERLCDDFADEIAKVNFM
jgi:hypothetical protein